MRRPSGRREEKQVFLGHGLRRLFPTLSEFAATVGHRTYMADGLITRHNADALRDPTFLAAYDKGRATGSWIRTDPKWRAYTACWAASHAAHLPGDFVECGVNRGGTALTIVEYLDFNSLDKRFFLLDTYQGIPKQFHDEATNRDLYSECYADVVRTFAPYRGVRIVRGVVPDTLGAIDATEISFLSIDMNCATPEIESTRRLWPRLARGGIVLLDDYAGGPPHEIQKRQFDALALELGVSILTLPTGQGLIVKP
jgi:O-methyltransferase